MKKKINWSFILLQKILGEEKTSLKYVDDKNTITSPCLQKYNYLYDNFNYANTSLVSSVDVIFTNKPSNTGGKYVTISYDEDTPALQVNWSVIIFCVMQSMTLIYFIIVLQKLESRMD